MAIFLRIKRNKNWHIHIVILLRQLNVLVSIGYISCLTVCLITFGVNIPTNLRRVNYRDNIYGLCEISKRKFGLFSVADLRRAGLAR